MLIYNGVGVNSNAATLALSTRFAILKLPLPISYLWYLCSALNTVNIPLCCLLCCCAEPEMFPLFQCSLFTDISGPSLGPVQIGAVRWEQRSLVCTRVFEKCLSASRLSCCFVKAAGQGEGPGTLLLSNEAPRGYMTHALRVPADAFHQQPSGRDVPPGRLPSRCSARLFLLLQHVLA